MNNTIRDNVNVGAGIENSDAVTVTENSFSGNGDAGLDLDGLSDATIAINEVDDNDVGIRDEGSTALLIDSNTLRNHGTWGIKLELTDEFTVRNNTIESTVDSDSGPAPANAAAVRAEFDSEEVGTVSDNTFESNDYGVHVATEDYTDDVLNGNLTIRDNDFIENTQGVEVYDEADEVIITNNTFNATDGECERSVWVILNVGVPTGHHPVVCSTELTEFRGESPRVQSWDEADSR